MRIIAPTLHLQWKMGKKGNLTAGELQKCGSTSVANSLFGNIRIFLSLTFYVKSILENLDALKLPFSPFFGL